MARPPTRAQATAPAPTVSHTHPNEGVQRKNYKGDDAILIHGADLQRGATVSFGALIKSKIVDERVPVELKVEIEILKNAVPGPRDVTVTNPDGQTGTGNNSFYVHKALHTDPAGGTQCEDFLGGHAIDIYSQDIQYGAGVDFGPDIDVINIDYTYVPGRLTVEIEIDCAAEPCTREITVTNPGAPARTAKGDFKVYEK